MIDINEPTKLTEELSEEQLTEYKYLLNLLISQIKKRLIWTRLAVGTCIIVGLLSIGYGIYLKYFSIEEMNLTKISLQYIIGIINIWAAYSGVVGLEKSKESINSLELELKSLEEKIV